MICHLSRQTEDYGPAVCGAGPAFQYDLHIALNDKADGCLQMKSFHQTFQFHTARLSCTNLHLENTIYDYSYGTLPFTLLNEWSRPRSRPYPHPHQWQRRHPRRLHAICFLFLLKASASSFASTSSKSLNGSVQIEIAFRCLWMLYGPAHNREQQRLLVADCTSPTQSRAKPFRECAK